MIDYVIAFALITGATIIVFRDDFLPDRFFYDGDRIQAIALGTGSSFGDQSYGNVALVYQLLGLAEYPTLAGLIGFSLFAASVIIVRVRYATLQRPVLTAVGFAITILLGAIYLGHYSKDTLVVGIVAIALLSSSRWRAEAMLLAAMLIYASQFRAYWYIVAVAYAGFRLVKLPSRGAFTMLALVGLCVVGMSLALSLVLSTDPDHFRTSANEYRLGTADAESAITPFVNIAQPVGGVVNNLITLFALVVPLPLAAKGGLYYLALTVVIAGIWISFFYMARRLRLGGEHRTPIFQRCFSLLLALLVVQALFEPDYGSALRHLTPLLPLMLVVLELPIHVEYKSKSEFVKRFGQRAVEEQK